MYGKIIYTITNDVNVLECSLTLWYTFFIYKTYTTEGKNLLITLSEL